MAWACIHYSTAVLGDRVPCDEPAAVHLWAAAGDPAQLPGAHVLPRHRLHVQVHDDPYLQRFASHQDLVTYVLAFVSRYRSGVRLMHARQHPHVKMFPRFCVPVHSDISFIGLIRYRERRRPELAVEG